MDTTPHHNESHHEHQHAHHGAASKLKGHASALEAALAPIFAQVPHLPQTWRKVITDVAPWLSLIFGILAIIGILGSGFLGILLSPLLALGNGIRGTGLFVSILLNLITAILTLLSFKPLQMMKKQGWNYSFYAFIVSTISILVSMLTMQGGLGNLIGVVIGAYFLFEVRERYN
jgi:hypothetical protein